MHRHVSLAAALATMAVIVPAGWHALDADIQVDGKRLRPLQQSFTVDGVKVTLDVDRSVVMTGDTVRAKLVAYSDTPKQVTVDVSALHSTNYQGERVEQPWTRIDRETIKLVAAPSGGPPVETAIKLGERPTKPALTDSFKVFVAAHGTKVPKRDYDEGEGDVGIQTLADDGKAAAVAIRGWSGNNLGIQIEAKGPVTLDAPFTIAVRVKNTSGIKLPQRPWIDLATEAALSSGEGSEDVGSIELERIDDPADAGSEDQPFKRGAEYVASFKVTPHTKAPHKLTFLASAGSSDGPGPAAAGALDAKTFTVSETKPSSVAAK